MEDIPLNIKTLVRYCNNAHYNCNLLMVTFAKANEGLDNYEKNELKDATEQYLSKGPVSMNIYSKVTLSVILVITILISFVFTTLIKKTDLIKIHYSKIKLQIINHLAIIKIWRSI